MRSGVKHMSPKAVLTAAMVATAGRSGLSPIAMSRRCWPFAIILIAKATTGVIAPVATGTVRVGEASGARGRAIVVEVCGGKMVSLDLLRQWEAQLGS